MARKSHAESEVEIIAVRLWGRAGKTVSKPYEAWSEVRAHLWGVSDGLRIAGKKVASELADDLGFMAGERAVMGLSQ